MADLVTELALGDIPTRSELGFGERFPDHVRAAARRRGDPLGDHVVAELARRHAIGDAGGLLAEVRALAETEGGVFRELVEACCYVPPWADFAAMEPGLRLFASTGPMVAVSILGGGVAGSAWHTEAEPVFTATGRFVVERGVAQRLAESGAIMFLLPLPGEVQPGGRHHAIVMKVRLLHAAIRRWLVAEGDYDVERFGVPINQEDMAFALLIFTYLNVRGLLRLGVRVTDEQIASLGLVWRWIGHVIGVDDELLCTDAAEQVELYKAFLARHTTDGDASVAALGLLDGALEAVPGPLRSVARRTIHQTTAYLGGAEYLEALELETSGRPWGLRALRVAGSAYGAMLRLPGAEAVLHRVGSMMLEARYKDAESHDYAVTTQPQADVAATMKRHAAAVATSRT